MKGHRKPAKKAEQDFGKFRKPYQATINPILSIGPTKKEIKELALVDEKENLVVRGKTVALGDPSPINRYIPKHLMSALFYQKVIKPKDKGQAEYLQRGWNNSSNPLSKNRAHAALSNSQPHAALEPSNKSRPKSFLFLSVGLRKTLIAFYEEIIKELKARSASTNVPATKNLVIDFGNMISSFKSRLFKSTGKAFQSESKINEADFTGFFSENFPSIEAAMTRQIFQSLADKGEKSKDAPTLSLEAFAYNLGQYISKADPCANIGRRTYEEELDSQLAAYLAAQCQRADKIVFYPSYKYKAQLGQLSKHVLVERINMGEIIARVDRERLLTMLSQAQKSFNAILTGPKMAFMSKLTFCHNELKHNLQAKRCWLDFVTSFERIEDLETLDQKFSASFDKDSGVLEGISKALDKFCKSKKLLQEDKFCLLELPEWVMINLPGDEEREVFFLLADIFKKFTKLDSRDQAVAHAVIYPVETLTQAFEKHCEGVKIKYQAISDLLESVRCLKECYFKPTLKHSINSKTSRALTKRFVLDLLLDIDKKIEYGVAFASELFSLHNDIRGWDSAQLLGAAAGSYKLLVKNIGSDLAEVKADPAFIANDHRGHSQVSAPHERLMLSACEKEDYCLPSKLVNPLFCDNFNTVQYTSLFPAHYYKNKVRQQLEADCNSSWLVRTHHVETLTEHPHSLKDNLVDVKYANTRITADSQPGSFYGNLSAFNSQQEQLLLQRIASRQQLISDLEQYLDETKNKIAQLPSQLDRHGDNDFGLSNDLQKARYFSENVHCLTGQENYGSTAEFSYEAILNELRKRETGLLTEKRGRALAEIQGGQRPWDDCSRAKGGQANDSLLTKLKINGLY